MCKAKPLRSMGGFNIFDQAIRDEFWYAIIFQACQIKTGLLPEPSEIYPIYSPYLNGSRLFGSLFG
jgi:hypothetical protein